MADSAQHEPHANIELTPVEARQAIMTGRMRYVLGISLALAVILMSIILLRQ